MPRAHVPQARNARGQFAKATDQPSPAWLEETPPAEDWTQTYQRAQKTQPKLIEVVRYETPYRHLLALVTITGLATGASFWIGQWSMGL